MTGRTAAPSILFASACPIVDPSNGASRTIKTFLRVAIDAGWRAASCDGPIHGMPDQLSDMGTVFQRSGVSSRLWAFGHADARASVRRARLDGIEVINVSADPYRRPPARTAKDADNFFTVLDATLRTMRPDVVLTYGGGREGRRLIRMARAHGAAVAFALFNTTYRFPDLFTHVDATFVPAEFMRRHYLDLLDLDSVILRDPIDATSVSTSVGPRTFLTFVSPIPAKGLGIASRVFAVLAKSRPDIPILVVEGRAPSITTQRLATIVGEHPNAFVMSTTRDPKHFLDVTRVLLMPSIAEPSGRTAAEAMLSGSPVVAANSGGLIETVGDDGVLVDLPKRIASNDELVATEEEARPWVEAIVRLWDDADHFRTMRARCLAAHGRLSLESVAPTVVSFFEGLRAKASGRRATEDTRSFTAGDTKLPRIPVVEAAVKETDVPSTETTTADATPAPELYRLDSLI